jgi:hypothetical protein
MTGNSSASYVCSQLPTSTHFTVAVTIALLSIIALATRDSDSRARFCRAHYLGSLAWSHWAWRSPSAGI